MMGTKNTAFVIAPVFDKHYASLKQVILTKVLIDLQKNYLLSICLSLCGMT